VFFVLPLPHFYDKKNSSQPFFLVKLNLKIKMEKKKRKKNTSATKIQLLDFHKDQQKKNLI